MCACEYVYVIKGYTWWNMEIKDWKVKFQLTLKIASFHRDVYNSSEYI